MTPAWTGGQALRRVAPFVTIGLVMALWQAAVTIGGVPSTMLPRPLATAQSFFNWFATGRIWPHVRATIGVAAGGYLFGALIGIGLAALMTLYKPVYRHLVVLMMAIQAIPKIALAPLLFMWLGFGPQTGVTLVTLACFYPMYVNAMEGFRSANADLIDLYRTFGAGRLRIFFSVVAPSALPQIFVGLEIATVFALIAAVVMEFIASARGLGFLIQDAANTLDNATVFTSVCILAIVGIATSTIVRLIRLRFVFWDAGAAAQAQMHGT